MPADNDVMAELDQVVYFGAFPHNGAPMTSLEDGVRRYVQEYLDREDSYV